MIPMFLLRVLPVPMFLCSPPPLLPCSYVLMLLQYYAPLLPCFRAGSRIRQRFLSINHMKNPTTHTLSRTESPQIVHPADPCQLSSLVYA
jgi:hypothetical protein